MEGDEDDDDEIDEEDDDDLGDDDEEDDEEDDDDVGLHTLQKENLEVIRVFPSKKFSGVIVTPR